MKRFPTFAIAVSLRAGTALISTPAVAQKKKKEAAAAQPAGWAPKISKAEAAVLQPIETAVAAKDWAAASAALAAAQPAVTSADGRYYLGQFQLQIGAGTNNVQLQAQGIDTMIASGGGDPTKAALLYKNQGALAMQAKDFAKAEAAYARWAQLSPNEVEAQMAVAETKFRQKKPAEAIPLFERAIAAQKAAGQTVPENWYKLALQSALDAKAGPKQLQLSRELIGAYPTAENWRNALLIFRQSRDLDPQAKLDTLRLMRSAKALSKGDEYLSLADALDRGNYPAEAKAVIDEGASTSRISASHPTAAQILKRVTPKINEDRAALAGLEARARSGASGDLAMRLGDGYYGHANYAKAAEFYRTALQKGSVDANVVNTRLGMALALAGQKAEAEAAFKAVTGPRAELAGLWMLWLNRRA